MKDPLIAKDAMNGAQLRRRSGMDEWPPANVVSVLSQV